MVVVECPWCDSPVEVQETALHCPACAVRVEIARDEAELAVAA
jgi:hypothetical protein